MCQPMQLPLALALIGSVLLAIGAPGGSRSRSKERKSWWRWRRWQEEKVPEPISVPAQTVVDITPVIAPSRPPKLRLITSDDAVPAGSVDDWVLERVHAMRGAKIKFREAYADYQVWCQSRGVPALEPDQFSERLAKICDGTDVYAYTDKSGTVFLLNVRLAANANMMALAETTT